MTQKRKFTNVTPKDEKDNGVDPLDKLISDFNKGKSVHKDSDFVDTTIPKPNSEKTKKTDEGSNESENDSGEQSEEEKKFNFEAQKIIFVKVANFLFTGINILVLNAVGKTKVKMDEMMLSEDELARLDGYVTEEMVKIIDFIPSWVFPIVHMEFIYLGKWKELVKVKEAEAAKKKAEEKKNEEKEEE